MEAVLAIQDIHKSFSSHYTGIGGKKEMELSKVLRGITLTIKEGDVLGILGTNGSGKSTLFNIISGLLKPDKGTMEYFYEGKRYNLCEMPGHKHAKIGIVRLFQGSNIFLNLSVMENLFVADSDRLGEYPWQVFHSMKKIEKRRKEAAEAILMQLLDSDNDLWLKINEKAGTLSIGQQRLLAFVRLFMNKNAALFLLDEPCAGVSIEIREKMMQMIGKLKEMRKSIILIEHNLDFVLKTCDDACYIEDGKIVMRGKVEEIINLPRLKSNYLGI